MAALLKINVDVSNLCCLIFFLYQRVVDAFNRTGRGTQFRKRNTTEACSKQGMNLACRISRDDGKNIGDLSPYLPSGGWTTSSSKVKWLSAGTAGGLSTGLLGNVLLRQYFSMLTFPVFLCAAITEEGALLVVTNH